MRGEILALDKLGNGDKKEMFSLLSRHFAGTTWTNFLSDLGNKNWVILIRDILGQIRGFSTVSFFQSAYNGEEIGVVCSGDTVIDPAARWSTLLAKTWLELVVSVGLKNLKGTVYWLYICSSPRTYRFLPVFYKNFYPGKYCDVGPEVAALASHLARNRWGRSYLPEKGIVRLQAPQKLKDQAESCQTRWARDPHTSFFQRMNPGWLNGDELVCLIRIAPDNLTSAGKRILRKIHGGGENIIDAASLSPEAGL